MLDLKYIRQNPEEVKEVLSHRSSNHALSIDQILNLDEQKRKLQIQADQLKAERNSLSKSVKSPEEAKEIKEQVKQINQQITSLDQALNELENEIKQIILYIPNLPKSSVPEGQDESQNQIVKTWGNIPNFQNPKPHWQIAEELGILDFENTAKFAGARLATFVGWGARLERALIQFMLDEAWKAGYIEFAPPVIVNAKTLQGTGQLPKFAEDLYKLEGAEQYLIPTAEVPLTSFYAESKTLSEYDLPKRLCAYTPCFRSEAGAAGRDTRGLIRQHQFDKVELVHLCKPEESELEHEKLISQAENILEKLNLSYRRVLLCAGDMGFSAAKCYDLEVWFPFQKTYREISSCSNCTDFQARRLNLKFKRNNANEYLHTLNGSGLAVGRTFAALVENYQTQKGFYIPEVLRPYLNNQQIIGENL